MNKTTYTRQRKEIRDDKYRWIAGPWSGCIFRPGNVMSNNPVGPFKTEQKADEVTKEAAALQV